jgi:transcriptional regulator with XRE-family HTH domain
MTNITNNCSNEFSPFESWAEEVEMHLQFPPNEHHAALDRELNELFSALVPSNRSEQPSPTQFSFSVEREASPCISSEQLVQKDPDLFFENASNHFDLSILSDPFLIRPPLPVFDPTFTSPQLPVVTPPLSNSFSSEPLLIPSTPNEPTQEKSTSTEGVAAVNDPLTRRGGRTIGQFIRMLREDHYPNRTALQGQTELSLDVNIAKTTLRSYELDYKQMTLGHGIALANHFEQDLCLFIPEPLTIMKAANDPVTERGGLTTGQLIRMLRVHHYPNRVMSQGALALAAGVPRSSLSHYELDDHVKITFEHSRALADYFKRDLFLFIPETSVIVLRDGQITTLRGGPLLYLLRIDLNLSREELVERIGGIVDLATLKNLESNRPVKTVDALAAAKACAHVFGITDYGLLLPYVSTRRTKN